MNFYYITVNSETNLYRSSVELTTGVKDPKELTNFEDTLRKVSGIKEEISYIFVLKIDEVPELR